MLTGESQCFNSINIQYIGVSGYTGLVSSLEVTFQSGFGAPNAIGHVNFHLF